MLLCPASSFCLVSRVTLCSMGRFSQVSPCEEQVKKSTKMGIGNLQNGMSVRRNSSIQSSFHLSEKWPKQSVRFNLIYVCSREIQYPNRFCKKVIRLFWTRHLEQESICQKNFLEIISILEYLIILQNYLESVLSDGSWYSAFSGRTGQDACILLSLDQETFV